MPPQLNWEVTAKGNHFCTSSTYSAVLEQRGDRWEVRVRARNGVVVAYYPKTGASLLLEGYTQQFICWQAVLRDESHLLEPWVDPWA